MGLSEQTVSYAALVKNVAMNDYGYWRVIFSAAPGVDSAVTVCQTGIDKATAVSLAAVAYSHLTGQRVKT